MTASDFLSFYPQFAGLFPDPVLSAYVDAANLRFDQFDEDVEEAIARRFPATRVIVTRGSKGAAAVGAGKPRVWQDAFPAKAVDTTAAGDTFEGFFLGRVAAGDDEQTALRCAAMAASIAVSRPGAGPSIPTLEEVIEALKARG